MKHDAKRPARRGWRSVGLTLFCALALLSLSVGCYTPRYYDSEYPRDYSYLYFPGYFAYYRVHYHRPPYGAGHRWSRWDRERWDWQHQRWEHQHERHQHEHRPQHDN